MATSVLDDILFVELEAEGVVSRRAVETFASAIFDACIVAFGNFSCNSGATFLRLFGDGGRRDLSPSASSASIGSPLELGSACLPKTYAAFSISTAETSFPESFSRRTRSSATFSKRVLYSLIVYLILRSQPFDVASSQCR